MEKDISSFFSKDNENLNYMMNSLKLKIENQAASDKPDTANKRQITEYKFSFSGDTVTVEISSKATINSSTGDSAFEVNDTIKLRNENGKWKIINASISNAGTPGLEGMMKF